MEYSSNFSDASGCRYCGSVTAGVTALGSSRGARYSGLTICDSHGYDAPLGSLAQQAVVEIAVNDDFLAPTVATITEALRLHVGNQAPLLCVMPIEEAVQVYRAVRGSEAVSRG